MSKGINDIKPTVKRPGTKCRGQNAAGNKALVTRPLSKDQWPLCRWGHNARPDKMPQPIIPLPIAPSGSKYCISFIIPHGNFDRPKSVHYFLHSITVNPFGLDFALLFDLDSPYHRHFARSEFST